MFIFCRIGLRTNRSRLNYEEFLHAFEDGRKSSYGNRPTKIDIVENHGLSPQDAENRVRETVAQQTDVLGRVRARIYILSHLFLLI